MGNCWQARPGGRRTGADATGRAGTATGVVETILGQGVGVGVLFRRVFRRHFVMVVPGFVHLRRFRRRMVATNPQRGGKPLQGQRGEQTPEQ